MSYVRGFLVSLLFTLIPYYLVINHVVSGKALLGTILGFAVLQMIVQVVFFLHLGREKSPHWQAGFLVATIGAILVVVGASLWIMHHLHYNMMTPVTSADESKKLVNGEAIYQIGGELTGACQGVQANHKVTIKNGQVSPVHTEALLCDTLTFMNEDGEMRAMTFGTQPYHGTYAGESELTVHKGRGKTITLSEPGTYQFYDYLHAESSGDFTVKPE
jgi:cytochrome o ubiquinol oxidase subunit IV